MNSKNIIWILAAFCLALPAAAQESEEEGDDRRHRVRVERRVLGPGSAIVIGEDGEETVIGGPRVEILGDGSHYVHLLGGHRQIGVQLTALTPELREHFGVDSEVGVMVSKVSEGSPAELAGVQVGDIITAIDSNDVDSSTDLVRTIREKEDGETVDLEVWRDGRGISLQVGVEEMVPRKIAHWQGQGGPGDRKVLVLPEIHMKDFSIDPEFLEQLKGSWEGVIELEDIQGVLESLGDYFGSEDWRERLKHIEEMDFESVEEKMKRVEERLRKLEEELEEDRE